MAGGLALGLGIGGVVLAPPAGAASTCTTVTGEQVPSNIAQYICKDGNVRQTGQERSDWEWQNLIDCALAAASKGYFARTAGTTWCLYNFAR